MQASQPQSITISDHVFKSDNPESTVNETAEMDLYRASLVSLQSDIAAANSQAKTNVKVGVVMLDSEVKLLPGIRPLTETLGRLLSSDL